VGEEKREQTKREERNGSIAREGERCEQEAAQIEYTGKKGVRVK
jgi:hypothetical protein